MKVIIPIKERTCIASGFNETPDVCIFDVNKELKEACSFIGWREIIPPGSKITLKLKEQGIYAVLTGEMQLLALNLFRENGINVYKSKGTNLYENLELLSRGELKSYSVEEALENNKLCGGQCNDCTSDTDCKE